jgi:hypothetical protein
VSARHDPIKWQAHSTRLHGKPPRPNPVTRHMHTTTHPGQVPSPHLPCPITRSPSPRSPHLGMEAPRSIDIEASAVARRALSILRPRHVVDILAHTCSVDLVRELVTGSALLLPTLLLRTLVDWICGLPRLCHLLLRWTGSPLLHL